MTTEKRKKPGMATKSEEGKASETMSPVLAFLSGAGPCPLPEGKRDKPGPLETAFLAGVESEIEQQDGENDRRPARERGRAPIASRGP